jgi:hypothetical protein
LVLLALVAMSLVATAAGPKITACARLKLPFIS